MSQYIYRYYVLCRSGGRHIFGRIFWPLILVNVLLNVLHGVSMGWADYPRADDADKIFYNEQVVISETGMTDLRIIAFVYAVIIANTVGL